MMSEADKAVLRRVFEEIWNRRNPALIDELFAPDFVSHTSEGVLRGREDVRRMYDTYVSAFPDLHFKVVNEVAEACQVAVQFTFRGTHEGEFMGIPPTGKTIATTGMVLARIEDGEVVENRVVWDRLSVMEQLGVTPPMAKAKGQARG